MTATSEHFLEPAPQKGPVLVVDDLTVRFPTHDGLVEAVTGLSYAVEPGRTLGIVGESGSGKSVSSMAVLGLHDPRSTRISGSIKINDTEVIGAKEPTLRRIRGNEVAMVFQDPLTALHPYFTIGRQIMEAYRLHHDVSKKAAKARAVEMLDLVGIPQPDRRVNDFPHQFSGGMRQRAVIAMSLVNNPQLIIADEPTTALDVTVQAQILDLMQRLQKEFNSAIIIVTHDLGVVAEMADDVLVMYGGRAVEFGPTKDVLTRPSMPYTWGLISSVPDVHEHSDQKLIPIPGAPPSLLDPSPGCAFAARCVHKAKVGGDVCDTELPEFLPLSGNPRHLKRCHLVDPEQIYIDEVAPEIFAEDSEKLES